MSITQPKVMYLNNKELLIAVRESKEKGAMSSKLATMLQLLCSKYATKGSFVNYSYNEDMQSYAMLMLVKTWDRFDLNKSNNPFAFFTQCIKNSFIQYLNQEKRQRNTRDALLVEQGLNPSFGYDDNSSDQHIVEDEQDYYYHKEIAQELQQHIVEDEMFKDDIDKLEHTLDDEIIDPENETDEEGIENLT